MNWIEWYFAKAKAPSSPGVRKLIFKKVKPGCSSKQLAIIAKSVLDVDDPTAVDWTLVRPAHLFLKKDDLAPKAMLSALSNITRLVSSGLVRRNSEYLRKLTGWSKPTTATKTFDVITPDQFEAIVEQAIANKPEDFAIGLACLMRLSYYCGLKGNQISMIRMSNLIKHNGLLYLFAAGRLIELSTELTLDINKHLRCKSNPRTAIDPVVFTTAQRVAFSKFPKLHETFLGLKRMRG